MRSKSGILPIIVLVVGLILMVAIFTTADSLLNPEPVVTVKASLKPSTAKVGKIVSLMMEFKNNDLASHQICCIFDTNPKVSIYAGDELLFNNEYLFTIEAADPEEERVLTVKGFLEEGISQAEYPISLNLYVDGNKISQESQKLKLLVKI